MPNVPGLRSPYARVGRLVYFGRMLDKIRLHAAGKLPPDYGSNLGDGRAPLFDARCCRFLGIAYSDLVERTRAGGTDAEVLAWVEARGTPRPDEECVMWNRFMMKIGWRDDRSAVLQKRVHEYGLPGGEIHTLFDLLDFDEGRDPARQRRWEMRPCTVFIVMGVAGSGKTTIGSRLAETLGWSFADADDFHPVANIQKMSSGQPLNDEDRAPWLRAIREHIDLQVSRDESSVVTCSALKHRYRDVLLQGQPAARLVYLKGARDLLLQRISGRAGHFMKAEMLDSQLAALEEPRDAIVVDVAPSPGEIVAGICAHQPTAEA